MSDLQGIADRVEIKALPGEYSDAAMTRDYDRFASLFTPGAAVRIPGAGIQLAGREAIRAGIEQLCRTEPVPSTALPAISIRRLSYLWGAARPRAGDPCRSCRLWTRRLASRDCQRSRH